MKLRERRKRQNAKGNQNLASIFRLRGRRDTQQRQIKKEISKTNIEESKNMN